MNKKEKNAQSKVGKHISGSDEFDSEAPPAHPLFGDEAYDYKKSELYPELPNDPTVKDVYTKKKDDFEIYQNAWYWGCRYYDLISKQTKVKSKKVDKSKKGKINFLKIWFQAITNPMSYYRY